MEYLKLDCNQNLIRLLYLSPASSDTHVIRCHFAVASLDENPDYEALSYVWGHTNDTQKVQVGGVAVTVTSNLLSALRHLRLDERERILWVDALCIDQADLDERRHQVSLMGRIYGQASRVVVWLGEGWNGSDTAMEFLRRLGEDKTLHLVASLEPNLCVNGLRVDSPELSGHIAHLFDLPWWKRTWTVQEFVLAQKLVFQCSRSIITREAFSMALKNFWVHGNGCCVDQADICGPNLRLILGQSFKPSARLDFLARARGDSYSILTAISSFCKREVTDPRDRVYGMLALGTGEYANLLEPDYTRSTEQVYEAVAMESIKRTRSLEIFSHLFGHHYSRLPSFIPHWTGPFEWSESYEIRLRNLQWFNASLDTVADFKLVSHKIGTTPGLLFDTITSTCQVTPEDVSSLAYWVELHQTAGTVESLHTELYGHTSDSRLLALWKSLCGGLEEVFDGSKMTTRRIGSSADLLRYFKWGTFCTASQQQKVEMWDAEFAETNVITQSATHGRRFFTTKKGYFGFGPEECEGGDLVAVMAGGKVPYIIRPVYRLKKFCKIVQYLFQDGKVWSRARAVVRLWKQSCYIILGDSYVHGIMDGEVFKLVGVSDEEFREIVLV
jgi:hypothetical protein